MIQLFTSRLRIIPLQTHQFQALLQNKQPDDIDFQLTKLDEDTHLAMKGLYQELIKNQDQWWWFTNWQIVLNQENIAIGSCCFVHSPDKNGVVEIGYGIDLPYRNQGYMTEAVQKLIDWTLQQPSISAVTAQTEPDNFGSQKVLLKCGMTIVADNKENHFLKFTTNAILTS
ncbi:MAG: GNAT family protein [Bacteroidales bacterium]|nr:GNAT family protein [Bacteroidales bacterium]